MFVLPSFIVKFSPEPGQVWNWRVNTEEALEAFCRILRLNGIEHYEVTKEKYPG